MNEKAFEDLVEAAWNVVDSGFEPSAFLEWRRNAHNCLTSMLGPDHVQTRRFAQYSRQTERDLAEGAPDTIKRIDGLPLPTTETVGPLTA